jgi:hypothetical protein
MAISLNKHVAKRFIFSSRGSCERASKRERVKRSGKLFTEADTEAIFSIKTV